MASTLLYVLQVDSARLRAKVLINGFEVYTEVTGAQRTLATKVNPYVVEGDNRVTVLLAPALDDEGKPLPRTGHFSLVLLVGEHGREPGPDALRLTWRWPPAEVDMPLERDAFVPAWEGAMSVSPRDAFGRWSWQDAPATALTDADVDEITELVRLLHSAFANRDAEALRFVLQHKHEELARALDVPASEIEDGFREYLTELFADPDGSLDEFFPADLLLQPVQGGRAVQVTDLGGDPPIQGQWNGEGFAFRMTLARVDGAWSIVR